ncbi:MAG: hypothetical protein LBN39_05410 [Planctomycetaceae bacterium]|jgi:hypothetical protein|nr:hypothetical protein [Planctomycetaceae bacterium]
MYYRKKHKADANEMVGTDSFLDVISNMVGILIILVMIAGVRAQQSGSVIAENTEPQVAEGQALTEIEAKQQEFQAAQNEALNVQFDALMLQNETEQLEEQTQMQSAHHAELFGLMTTLRAEIELQAENKDKGIKEQIEFQRQLQEIDVKLAQISKTKEWLTMNRPKATVIENIPTPISKTVGEKDKEVHFRLLNGKIVYVPFPELMEKMKNDVVLNQNKYKKEKSTEGRAGPVDNFYLDFLIVCYDAPMRDSYGVGVGKYIELEYAELMPVSENAGEPLRQALANPQSELLRRLKNYRQDIYTVTVWVYPDSYEEYGEFKKVLYAQGYKVAGRPMEFGHPISGSPRGSRSAAQ